MMIKEFAKIGEMENEKTEKEYMQNRCCDVRKLEEYYMR